MSGKFKLVPKTKKGLKRYNEVAEKYPDLLKEFEESGCYCDYDTDPSEWEKNYGKSAEQLDLEEKMWSPDWPCVDE